MGKNHDGPVLVFIEVFLTFFGENGKPVFALGENVVDFVGGFSGDALGRRGGGNLENLLDEIFLQRGDEKKKI
jgi:hypothetical protein